MQTNLKKRPFFLFGVFYFAFFGIASSNGFALTVANGGFSDTNGLTPQADGWYQGVPAGWTSTASNPGWAVFNGAGNPAPTANLNTLSTLRQNVGTNAVPSLVTLTFDVGAFGGAPSATVKITDGGSTIFGSGTYPVGNGQTLSAYTPANVPIYIEFGGGQVAWVDNVSVSSVPSVPGLSLTNGNFADLSGTTETGGGWFGGVPAGWSTTAPTNGYAIFTIGGTNYANLNTLGTTSGGFHPLRQDLGTASTASDVTISFKATSLTASSYYLASAIYSKADPANALAVFETPALIQGSSTITYSARNVAAGTELYVAFWTLSGFAPGITDVTVSTAVSTPTINFASNAVFELDPSQPVSSNCNLNFAPGSKIKVVGTNAPSGSAVPLLSTGGTITGSPALESAVNGYELALSAGNVLWLRQGLAIINGNFQETTGLRSLGGGWYGGVPTGWTGLDDNYSVMDWNSGNLAANLDQLTSVSPTFAPLYQSAGLLDSAAVVSLSFDILHFAAGPTVGVGIFNTHGSSNYSDWTALALPGSGGYTTDGRITLETAAPIAAGTSIGVAFWHSGAGAPGIDNVALSVTYANRAPTDISLSGASISENNLIGDVVGTLSATDPDAGDTHSFSLVSGDGDTGNSSFEIVGSTLQAKIVFDHETQASYSIRVRSTDGGGLTTEKTFTVTVTDVAEQTPQQAYVASFGLSGDDLLGTADPDGDGMDNDAEFAFGTSPVSGASRAATLSTGTGTIKLTYLQRNSGVTYTVKSLPSLTTDFDSGTDVGPVASEPQPSGIPGDYTQFEASITTGSARGFLRVRAVAD